jgi:hypothetical protein
MVGASLANCTEIRGYIKGRTVLVNFKKVVGNNGKGRMSYRTVCRWAKKFASDRVSIENDTKNGRKVSVSTKLVEARIQEL